MTLVLDASAAYELSTANDHEAIIDQLASQEFVFSPRIFSFEMAQLFFAKYKERTFPPNALVGVQNLTQELDTDWDLLPPLIKRHNLSAYDASYLELALRERATLLTLDKKLRKAALAEGLDAPTL